METHGLLDTTGYTEGTLADLKQFSFYQHIAFDFETNSTKPQHPEFKILSVAFSAEKGISKVFFAPFSEEQKLLMKHIFVSNSAKYVASRPFEDTIVKREFKVIPVNMWDVLTMAHVLDENNFQYNLEIVAEKYAGMINIKNLAEGMRANLIDASRELIINYNGVDADATLRAGLVMRELLEEEPRLMNYYKKFIIPIQNMLTETVENGCKIDLVTLSVNDLKARGLLDRLEETAMEKVPEDIKEKHLKKGLKLSRKSFIHDVVFEGLKCKPDSRFLTPKGKISVKEDHLKMFSHKKFVSTYLEWAKLEKVHNTYLETIGNFIYPDGKVYPSTLLTRTVTGRCLIADSMVTTEVGLIPIQDIPVGLKVLTHTGELKEVTASNCNGIKKVFKVTTKSGKQITATENHPFLTPDGWKPLKDLTLEDSLYVLSCKE